MENKHISFFDIPEDFPNLSPDRRDLYQTLHSALVYIPILLAFNFIGLGIIYTLGKIGLLSNSDERLLLVAAISLITSILHLPLFPLLRRGKIESVTIGLLIIDGLGAAAQIFLWEGIIWLPLLLIASPAIVFAAQRGLRTSSRVFSLFFGIFVAAGIWFANQNITYTRMSPNSLTEMAGLAIFLMVMFIMVILVLISSRISFRTISGRLVLTFTFVVAFSAITTLIIAALVGLFHDQQNMLRQLNAVSTLKQTQVEVVLTSLENDINAATDDAVTSQRMRFLIDGTTTDNLLYQFNNELVRAFLEKIQQGNAQYDEILLLNNKGSVILTTLEANEKRDFSKGLFFQRALSGFTFTIEKNFPGSASTSIVVARPILENGIARGYLIARIPFDAITAIMTTQTSLGNTLETYMVGKDLIPLTNTQGGALRVNTVATDQAISQSKTGSGLYTNYASTNVLGYYVWMPNIQVALITEIDRVEVIQGILTLMITNVTVGLFTVLITFAIIYITSRSISNPLVSLAEKATALASGELSTRIVINRQDEIGTLASSFNTMAGELQNLVRTLEQKVEDRTHALQSQANRFRVAAEVARDATTAHSLDELLNRSAQLVLERFNFYHTGIFLVDSRREFAILKASPTEAGRQMIANSHRLKVGEVGIVGNVAATGQPRITLNTGQDASYFNNPFLPNTRSEIALPLKVEGEVIGVLDVQSELPEAFAQEDIAVLQIMADQLAISIRRVQLVQALEESLGETERVSQKFTLASWRSFSDTPDFKPGYRYDGTKISPITSFPTSSQEILRRGHSVILSDGSHTKDAQIAVPLKLRDQVIGVLNIQFNSAVSQDTIGLLEDAASRLAIALENARLYTETQKLAERERAVSEIATRITTSSNIDNILRTTVLELGRMLPNAEVTVQIQENK